VEQNQETTISAQWSAGAINEDTPFRIDAIGFDDKVIASYSESFKPTPSRR